MVLLLVARPAHASFTFDVSPVKANPFELDFLERALKPGGQVVYSRTEYKNQRCSEVIQSSSSSTVDGDHDDTIIASANGFVQGAVRAYNQHHHLILRPDDVWLAIMTQFGLFVNGHAEAVRDKLVKHKEGTQGLVVKTVGSLRTVDHGFLATQLVQQMTDHLVDPALSEWVLPSFSTTTDHDRVVGSVVMLAAAKKYFTYKSVLSCGIPSVTLHGSVSDWQEIRRRVTTLSRFDHILTAKWQRMLEPVLDQFVAAANNTPDVGFWRRICHAVGGGSGPSYLSGWITLFSVFNDQGEWMGDPRTESVTMWRTSNVQGGAPAIEAHVETIGGDFPVVEMADVAPGYLTVDVTVIDHSVRFTTVLFAGHLAYKVEGKNAIQPTLAWAMALKPRERKNKAAACDQDSQVCVAP
ncbi:hypothetical protein B5M09_006076 [Aphanomyces astaci]|nr:hypothetical protein B5M09_006076 [Aphanomyces astaci]